MSRAVEVHSACGARPFRSHEELFGPFEGANASSLAETLLAIAERRGELFMLEISRHLIERWDLRCDELNAQTDETLHLVAKLLKVQS
jgi:hypothetical protein